MCGGKNLFLNKADISVKSDFVYCRLAVSTVCLCGGFIMDPCYLSCKATEKQEACLLMCGIWRQECTLHAAGLIDDQMVSPVIYGCWYCSFMTCSSCLCFKLNRYPRWSREALNIPGLPAAIVNSRYVCWSYRLILSVWPRLQATGCFKADSSSRWVTSVTTQTWPTKGRRVAVKNKPPASRCEVVYCSFKMWMESRLDVDVLSISLPSPV